MSTIDFKDFLSREDYQAIADYFAKEPGADAPIEVKEAFRQGYNRLPEDILAQALVRHLGARKAAGLMEAVAHSQGYSTRFIDSWNSAAQDGENFREYPNQVWTDLVETMPYRLLDDLYRLPGQDEPTPAVIDAAYEKLIRRINQGDFSPHFVEAQDCWETGQRIHVKIDGWRCQAGLLTRDPETRRTSFVPAPPPEPNVVKELDVDFPSGRVLVADWFRLEEFTRAVNARGLDFNINSRVGKEQQTEFYASQHGFVSVFVGNSMPEIFAKGDTLAIGLWNEEGNLDKGLPPTKPAMPGKGKICTDLWWATLIDREHLIDLVAEGGDRDAAAAKVDAYVAEHKGYYGVTEVKMPPGTYYLYHNGKHHDFGKMLDRDFVADDLPLTGIDEVFFVLSNKRLEPRLNPETGVTEDDSAGMLP